MASKYGNPRGQAATDAKRKYNSKNYDRIYPYVKKGKNEKRNHYVENDNKCDYNCNNCRRN